MTADRLADGGHNHDVTSGAVEKSRLSTPAQTFTGADAKGRLATTLRRSITLRRRPRRVAKELHWRVTESDGVVLDGPRRRVLVDGCVMHLSAREAAVLGVLMARAGRLVYRPTLAAAAGGNSPADRGGLDRLVRRLRRRIEPSPLSPVRLRRVGDAGYVFGSTPRDTSACR